MSYEIGTLETTAGTVAEGAADADADDVVDTDGVCCVVLFCASSLYEENGDDM